MASGRGRAGALPATGGFTLLEALVALAIVGIGFAWAFGAMPESLAAQTRARNLEAATGLAESLLAQASAGAGTESRFAWHVAIAPFQAAGSQSGDIGGQVVAATVAWAEGANQRTITLQTIRLGTAPRGS